MLDSSGIDDEDFKQKRDEWRQRVALLRYFERVESDAKRAEKFLAEANSAMADHQGDSNV